ncbi:MAG: amidohydrolase family protein, partial [Chthoniobacterales bacterium]
MLYTNGRLVFPDRVADGFSLRVAAGKIAEIGELAPQRGEELVDLGGNFLAPGFIDLHVHGALGRDTMDGTTEAFRAICNYHASGGTTSVCLTTVTAPLEEVVRVVRAIEAALPEIPQLRGAHVEGPFIAKEKHGAQRPEFIVEPPEDRVRQL